MHHRFTRIASAGLALTSLALAAVGAASPALAENTPVAPETNKENTNFWGTGHTRETALWRARQHMHDAVEEGKFASCTEIRHKVLFNGDDTDRPKPGSHQAMLWAYCTPPLQAEKTFHGFGQSVDSDAARLAAIDEAIVQMNTYTNTEHQSCDLKSMNVEFKHILKIRPPVYVWSADLTYTCKSL